MASSTLARLCIAAAHNTFWAVRCVLSFMQGPAVIRFSRSERCEVTMTSTPFSPLNLSVVNVPVPSDLATGATTKTT